MRFQPVGSAGFQASIIGLGAWVLGGGSVWGQETDDTESIRTIQAAIDGGISLIDTAPAYGFGRSERVVGAAIRGRREKVILATKCGLWWKDARGSEFTEFDGRLIRRSLRPDTIREELEESLRNLGVETIDLYQVHWPAVPPEKTPIAQTMEALMDLQRQGKIRAIGVSNLSLQELSEYQSCGSIAAHQFRYSMLFREPESTLLAQGRRDGLASLTYMSLEQGLLTGKVGMDRVFPAGDFRTNAAWNPWYKPENRPRVLSLLAGWQVLAQKYCCSLSQLVLAWTAAQPGVTHILCGARTVQQAVENAAAGDLVLAEVDLQSMRRDLEALGKAH